MSDILSLWCSQNTHWYFFSTLAQSSLAFTALLAVLAVFRLQVNEAMLKDSLQDACAWLEYKGPFSKSQIKAALENYSVKKNNSELMIAALYLHGIKNKENFPDDFVKSGTQAMKRWGLLFALSLLFLFLPVSYECRFLKFLSLSEMIGTGILTCDALLRSKKFMQNCLNKKEFVGGE